MHSLEDEILSFSAAKDSFKFLSCSIKARSKQGERKRESARAVLGIIHNGGSRARKEVIAHHTFKERKNEEARETEKMRESMKRKENER